MTEKRRLAGTLTRPNRLITACLAGAAFDEAIINETTRWGNRLQADAERWMQRGGFGERGRINKADAHRLFAMAFSGKREGGR
jgi:hypothetical protein